MTDKEKLIDLLNKFGVEFEDVPDQVNSYQDIFSVLTCVAGTGMNKVDGYAGFMVNFNFDKNDKFINIGIWE